MFSDLSGIRERKRAFDVQSPRGQRSGSAKRRNWEDLYIGGALGHFLLDIMF